MVLGYSEHAGDTSDIFAQHRNEGDVLMDTERSRAGRRLSSRVGTGTTAWSAPLRAAQSRPTHVAEGPSPAACAEEAREARGGRRALGTGNRRRAPGEGTNPRRELACARLLDWGVGRRRMRAKNRVRRWYLEHAGGREVDVHGEDAHVLGLRRHRRRRRSWNRAREDSN